jgi:hypothetical protein
MIEITCDKGHKYFTFPSYIKMGRGCPYCSGQRVCDENSFVKNFPEVAKKWDYSKNTLNPELLTKGSNRKAWWVCNKGHSFESHVVGMVQGIAGCPYCYGRKPSPENNVLTKFPEIAKEWDSNKNIKSPEDYSATSRETVWWKCKTCLNTWEARIDSRTHSKNGCPYCSGRNATSIDNLLVKYPLISKEWDYDKNGTRPEEYRSHSEKKAWWRCLVCGNGWKTTISHRVEGTGCPSCTKIALNDGEAFDSLTEAFVYLEYKNDGIVFERQKRYPNNRMKCDFFIPKENKYVEVTGYHNRSDGACSGHFSYIDYLRKIVSKRRICRNNGVSFEFRKIKLTKDQIHQVRAFMKNNS